MLPPLATGGVELNSCRAVVASRAQVLGRYNWTTGAQVAKLGNVQSAYGLRRDVRRVLALSPEVDLSRTRSWEELGKIIAGLMQVRAQTLTSTLILRGRLDGRVATTPAQRDCPLPSGQGRREANEQCSGAARAEHGACSCAPRRPAGGAAEPPHAAHARRAVRGGVDPRRARSPRGALQEERLRRLHVPPRRQQVPRYGPLASTPLPPLLAPPSSLASSTASLCTAELFSRLALFRLVVRRVPLPVIVPVDERGELVGGWARRLLGGNSSSDAGRRHLSGADTFRFAAHPDPDGADDAAAAAAAAGGRQPRRRLAQSPAGGVGEAWWARQRLKAVIPAFWDPTCTQGAAPSLLPLPNTVTAASGPS